MKKHSRNSEIFYPSTFGYSKEQIFQEIDQRIEQARTATPMVGKDYWSKYRSYDKRLLTKERMQYYVDQVGEIIRGYNPDRRSSFLEYQLCILATSIERKDDEKARTEKVHSR